MTLGDFAAVIGGAWLAMAFFWYWWMYFRIRAMASKVRGKGGLAIVALAMAVAFPVLAALAAGWRLVDSFRRGTR